MPIDVRFCRKAILSSARSTSRRKPTSFYISLIEPLHLNKKNLAISVQALPMPEQKKSQKPWNDLWDKNLQIMKIE